MRELKEDYPVFAISEYESSYWLMNEMQPDTDLLGRKYEMVTQALEDDDFYQGLNMITVIRRVEDGKLFGYSWWNNISKHGEAYIQDNSDEYGIESDAEDDEHCYSYFVFTPVEEYSITAYRHL